MGNTLSAQEVYVEVRQGLGVDICRLIDSDGWSDIQINPDGKVYMDTSSNREIPGCSVNPNGLINAALVLAGYWGLSFNSTSHQSLDCVIPIAGLRANFVRPPAVDRICATFRKPNPRLITMDEQVRAGTMTPTQKVFLESAIREHKNIIFSGGTGCHGKGTTVMMADGSCRRIEDIQAGDRVMGDDGTVRTVLSLHRGRDMMYRVKPRKGEPFVVNGGHILRLKGADGDQPEVEILARDFNSMSENWRRTHYLYYCSGIGRFDRPSRILPVPPYVLGALIGDGSMTDANGLTLCNPDEEVVDAFRSWVESRGWAMRKVNQKDASRCPIYGIRVNEPGVRGPHAPKKPESEYICLFRQLGLYNHTAGDKFVPDDYKFGDRNTRLEILAGLLDTDGHLNVKKGGYDFISKSSRLAQDVAFIARSLGFYSSVQECRKSCQTGYTGTYYRVALYGDLERIPCRVERKRFEATDRISRHRTLISSFTLEELGEDEYYGIEVDGNSLYLLSGFCVTRNSGKTTLANSLITLIDPAERIVSIEDVRELIFTIPDYIPGPIRHRNYISSLINRDYSYADGIAAALRQRPDRILIGECRYGRQALEMLKAWNTGHPGGITTIHANSAEDVFRRLEQLCGEVSASSQMEMIKDAVDVVCQMDRIKGTNKRTLKELLDVRKGEFIK